MNPTRRGATARHRAADDAARPEPRTDHAEHPAEHQDDRQEDDRRQLTLLEQMGGIAGLVYSTLPVLVFIGVNAVWSLQPAIWAAVGAAVAVTLWRLIRREALQPAISGFFGVAIAAFIAYRTGSAKGFFLFGIWTSLVYGGAFLVSVVVRWPLVGLIWSTLNGTGSAWRADQPSRFGYDVATLVWVLVFGARFVVQRWLYESDLTGWLAFARIAMGYPLTALALLASVWAVRRADKRRALPAEPEAAGS
jgi:hypothetical protein